MVHRVMKTLFRQNFLIPCFFYNVYIFIYLEKGSSICLDFSVRLAKITYLEIRGTNCEIKKKGYWVLSGLNHILIHSFIHLIHFHCVPLSARYSSRL